VSRSRNPLARSSSSTSIRIRQSSFATGRA
jgi:hypothetical protein